MEKGSNTYRLITDQLGPPNGNWVQMRPQPKGGGPQPVNVKNGAIMYRFPSSFQPECFVGKALTSIVFSENTVTLNFGMDDRIHIYHGLDIDFRGKESRFMFQGGQEPAIEARLGHVLGREVSAVEVFDGVTLRVTFDNGFTIDVLGDVENYECYEVRIGGAEFLI